MLYGPAPARPESSPKADPQVSIIPRERPKAQGQTTDISVDVNVAIIPVTVTDPLGNTVTGLPIEAFHVLENGVEQPISHLGTSDAPLSVGIVFDASNSMLYKLDKSRKAIDYLLNASTPGDEYFLVEFGDKPKLLFGFTEDTHEIQGALQSIRATGWTSLLDAIHLSVGQMKKAKNPRRALVILSDGGDNNSAITHGEIRRLLRETDVSLYVIGILGPMVTPASKNLLRELAEDTGGRLFPVRSVDELPDATAKLNTALRDQYLLAYYPTNANRDGKYRRVQVRVVAPPNFPSLRISSRSGYYAPPQ